MPGGHPSSGCQAPRSRTLKRTRRGAPDKLAVSEPEAAASSLEDGGDLLRCDGDVVIGEDEGGVDTGEFSGHGDTCASFLMDLAQREQGTRFLKIIAFRISAGINERNRYKFNINLVVGFIFLSSVRFTNTSFADKEMFWLLLMNMSSSQSRETG